VKTYKREIAAISLAVMYLFIAYTLHTLAQLNQTAAMVDLVGILVIPTFATVAAAFGIDSYFKQNKKEPDKEDKP
jgi:choline-glycine betaine transporter